MKSLKNVNIKVNNLEEVKKVLKLIEKFYPSITWMSGLKPLEFIPQRDVEYLIIHCNKITYASSSNNDYKIITIKEVERMTKNTEIEFLVDYDEEKDVVKSVEIMNSKLSMKELKRLERGLKKQINKILKNQKIKDKAYEINKEIDKTLKKVLSKEEKLKNQNGNKNIKPIKIKDIEIDDYFEDLCNYVSENLLKYLDLNKETTIKEIKVWNDCIITIDVYGKKSTKNPIKFIEKFFDIYLSGYRKELVYGWFRFKDYEFEITDKVRHYYLEDNYDINSKYSMGALSSSCMRYENCNEYMKFYEKEGIKLLILKNKKTDKIIGRALIWDDTYDEDGEEFKFIDRIYGDDITIAMFRRWAYQNSYACKKYQSYDEKEYFLLNGRSVKKYVYYDLKNDIDEYRNSGIPYMDTMTFYNKCSDYLTNDSYESDYDLDSTDGNEHIFEKYVECSICGREILEYDAEWHDGEPYCETCWEETLGWCEECGERITEDDLMNGDAYEYKGGYYCESCFEDNFVYCENIEKNNEKYDIRKHIIIVKNEEEYNSFLDILERYYPEVRWNSGHKPKEWIGAFYSEYIKFFIIYEDNILTQGDNIGIAERTYPDYTKITFSDLFY